jgi:hypothetical protein
LPTLQRIAAVLDEELLVCFQRTVEGEVERELTAPRKQRSDWWITGRAHLGRAAQKARYGGELYPAEWPADADGTTYLDFFQHDRLKQQKGIIALDLTGLP